MKHEICARSEAQIAARACRAACAQQDDCIVISEISRRDVSCITEKGEIYYDGKIKSHA